MKNVKILVCCHKQDVMATQPPYLPIQVGKALSDVDLGIQGDDTGDNISHKNRSYCELTGLYWAWKNLKDVDIIGLCHYRRYFDFHHRCRPLRDSEIIPSAQFDQLDLSIPQKIIDRIRDGVCVAAAPKHYVYNLYLDYCQCHISDDMRLLQQIFVESQTNEMQRAFYRVMYMNNKLRPTNMFLMTWHDFDAYCTWLFGILGEVERRTDISHYNAIQTRIYGYMAERLFNIYLRGQRFTVLTRPIFWVNDNPPKHTPRCALRILQRQVRGWLVTKLTNPRERVLESPTMFAR